VSLVKFIPSTRTAQDAGFSSDRTVGDIKADAKENAERLKRRIEEDEYLFGLTGY